MSAIKGVLEEELSASRRLLDLYERELAKLPEGTVVSRRIKGRDYYYRAHREGKKVVTDYLGRLSAVDVAKAQEEKKKKKEYRRLIAEVKYQIRFLERSLKYGR
ncbi:MAG: hypothetical protein GXY80_14030 [Syntrophorhabdus aromaticivorans]|jgi:hypothetical protein|uniref:DUF6788 domain-containing protein n=1 Tax=Syntrophorhabdus aromaticivorans TaxID=328301 RepID=A0A971M7D9_9BACT|nr:hypothetical protein [Syntrophorhabdus aromaticivorans]